jgi:hypothetical protein
MAKVHDACKSAGASNRRRERLRATLGCPGERQNGTLRFTVGRSTLTQKGCYRQSRKGERVSVLEAQSIGNSPPVREIRQATRQATARQATARQLGPQLGATSLQQRPAARAIPLPGRPTAIRKHSKPPASKKFRRGYHLGVFTMSWLSCRTAATPDFAPL